MKGKACWTLCRSPFVRRYTRSEPFTALNVDVRFQRHLFESLEAFVKGDLLEGNNAYQCEKCNKKVGKVWGVWQVDGLDPPSLPHHKGGHGQKAVHQETAKGACHPTQEI